MGMRDVTYGGRTACQRRNQRGRRGGGRSRATRRSSAFWVVLAVLLAINLAVFFYHGKPWATVGSVSSSSPAVAAAPTAVATKAADPSASSAADAPQEDPGGSPTTTRATATSASSMRQLDLHLPIAGSFAPRLGLVPADPVQRVETVTLLPGQAPAVALRKAGVQADDIDAAIRSLQGLVDFRLMRPGHKFKLRLDANGRLLSMDVLQGLLRQTRCEKRGGEWQGVSLDIKVEAIEAQVSVVVRSSLWEAIVQDAGEDSRLVHDLVEIFAWEIDFYSEVHAGDSLRLLVDKRFAEGQFVGYGPIKAAEFISSGVVRRAYWHPQPPAQGTEPHAGDVAVIGYFDANGGSLRKQLLKAPLKYGHVTSTFGRRRHPVLGYTRSHNGTDYGVPTGTPVWSVGGGTVVRAGWHGGFGRLVEVRHPNGWLSQYAHLSRIAVKVGTRVEQKQVIGNVGSTGLSTAPHLHYGLKKNGKYVNSLLQTFAPGKALAGDELAQFHRQVTVLQARLGGTSLAQLNAKLEVD